MGSRGVSSKGLGRQKVGNANGPLKLSKDARTFAKDFGINIDKSSFKDTVSRYTDEGLQVMKELADYLGVTPEMVPNVEMLCDNLPGASGQTVLLSWEDNLNKLKIDRGLIDFNFSENTDINFILEVYAHEYVHVMESFLVKRNLADEDDRRNAWNDCEFSKSIINKALTDIGLNPSDWKKSAGLISDYAKTDHSEFLAEVGAKYIVAKRNNFSGCTATEKAIMVGIMRHLKKALSYHKSYRK